MIGSLSSRVERARSKVGQATGALRLAEEAAREGVLSDAGEPQMKKLADAVRACHQKLADCERDLQVLQEAKSAEEREEFAKSVRSRVGAADTGLKERVGEAGDVDKGIAVLATAIVQLHQRNLKIREGWGEPLSDQPALFDPNNVATLVISKLAAATDGIVHLKGAFYSLGEARDAPGFEARAQEERTRVLAQINATAEKIIRQAEA